VYVARYGTDSDNLGLSMPPYPSQLVRSKAGSYDCQGSAIELPLICDNASDQAQRASMTSITIAEIDERLRHLPREKLLVVYDFVSYLLDRDIAELLPAGDSGARHSMLASEAILRRDWDRPEEDAAWAHL